MNLQKTNYSQLINNVGRLLLESKQRLGLQINTALVTTYWNIGKYIVEFEQGGDDRAQYGSELLLQLSRDLSSSYGKGFSRSNLTYMRKFYLKFPTFLTLTGQFEISETASHILSWSHYFEILKADSDLEIDFYVKQSCYEKWSVRELKRQMKNMLFHRIALSKDKKGVIELSQKGIQTEKPEDIIKDPYVLEFLNIPLKDKYLEGQLEDKIIENLQHFLLELGKGFAFIGRQFPIHIGSRHFYADLVFYHRILKCFVIIDLKRGEIEHKDIGQMNLYLNYFKEEENTKGDNDPIGIVLGAYKDHILMEYATANLDNQLFVSKYQLYLPNREELEKELINILEKH